MFHSKLSRLFMVSALFSFVLLHTFTGCGVNNPPAVGVAVTAAASTVDGNDATTLTATVSNDKASAGVTWTLSGAGALSKTTTSSATYTAPAPTSSSQSVTITATSIADTSKVGTATITIPAAPSVTSTSASLTGAVGSIYSITLQASGGIAPYSWALGSGTTLPTCLTLKSTGVLTTTSGTAPAASCAGTYSDITFTVTDSGTATPLTATSPALTISIVAAPAITFTGAVPATGTYNAAYSGSAAATGGAGALAYSISGGSMPGGLSLNPATGAITGMPSAVGTFNFTVQAADAYGDSNTQSYQIVVSYSAVVIAPGAGSLPFAVTGQSYSETLTASGGSGAGFTWTVTGLPANGLTYAASGAALTISGPATTAGTVSFTAKATDNASNSSGALAYSIQVYSPVTLPATIPSTLPSTATVNVAYTGTVVATGGSGNYSWTVTGLTDGLTSSSSGGTLTISGTPTAAATVTANVSVKDTTTNVTSGPFAYTITVYATVTLPTSNPSTLGPAIVSTLYSGTIVAAGGSGNYSWTVTGFPSDGLNYATSGATLTVSGTPTTVQTVNFTAKVTDTTSGLSSGPYNYSVTVYNPVTLSSTSLPLTAYVGTAYSGTITASGGSGTGYVWTVTGLSDGLSSASSGGTLTISGTPTSAAAVTFTASVKDSVGNSAGPTNYTITVYGALSLPASNSLPSGYTGVAYTGSVTGSGGSGNLSIAVTSALAPSDGTLATNVSGATVNVTGTPTTATTVSFSVKLTDTTTSSFITQTYSITITTPVSVSLPAPNPSSLPSATQNQSYTGNINASGGVSPYTWSINGTTVTSGGISLSNGTLAASNSGGNTLTIGGTPSTAGTVTLTNVKVVDSLNTNATQTYTISVAAQTALTLPLPSTNPLPQGTINQAYNGSISASGGSGSGYAFTVAVGSGTAQAVPTSPSTLALTAGLYASSSGNTMTITGTPTAPATVTLTIAVTDSASDTTSETYTFNIINPAANYAVSGTVSYSGAQTGWIYLELVPGSGCTDCGDTYGTAISAPGAFTINGVPTGTYTLRAFMDNLATENGISIPGGGYGAENASNPTGSTSNVTVSTGNLTGVSLTLANPSAVTLSSAPSISGVSTFNGGAFVTVNPLTNGNGIETPSEYGLLISSTSSCGSGSTLVDIPATGANGGKPWIVPGLTNGQIYYFCVEGVVGNGGAARLSSAQSPRPPARPSARPRAPTRSPARSPGPERLPDRCTWASTTRTRATSMPTWWAV